MNSRQLLDAIGKLDESFYINCEAYQSPKRGKTVIKCSGRAEIAIQRRKN